MKRRLRILAGYTAAVLTIAVAMLTPFLLIDRFTRGVAALDIRVDPVYSGGDVAYTLPRAGYRIVVNHAVVPKALLSQGAPFVQVAWEPASALPSRVLDEVDVTGDGRPDLVASFPVPRDPVAPLAADVRALSPQVESRRGIGRESFSALIARVGDRIVLRIPVKYDR